VSGKAGVAGFFGTWTGDETDAELLAVLNVIDSTLPTA